ncbi:MAG: right-handed parallel beta-helix repeat-containing protein [Flavobacteriales bacterium]|nr:right-handed parallel beta-helix repeat-containing protein [Flavobacteriales bacterium]
MRADHLRTPGIAFATLLSLTLSATDYHVSSSGNDNNAGTSPAQAWRTIGRLSQVFFSLQAGDRILFERGGVYRGTVEVPQSGTAAQPIVVGAYGSGARPVIDGSTTVTGWVQHQGNIWKAPMTGPVSQVFVDGAHMTLARYPNNGWLRNDQGTSSSLHDDALGQPNGYWTGATLVVRSTFWSYSTPTVQSFNNGTLGFQPIWYDLYDYDWGYFLCNKLEELDSPGEWYHDQNTGELYLWAPGGGDPGAHLVEATTREKGLKVYWQREHIVIRDLEFRHQLGMGVHLDGGRKVRITNCKFDQLERAVQSYGWENRYDNNVFSNTFATACELVDENSIFEDNVMQQIAMVPGLGESDWGYFGLRMAGAGNIVRNNLFEDIGYIGVAVDHDALVERNVVRNATAILNDGAGISFDFADGMIIQDNIVIDTEGSIESSAPDHHIYEKANHGIYFGNTVIQNTIVRRNTVTGSSSAGIHVDHTMLSSGNQVVDNVLFNNDIQLSISDYSNYNTPNASPPYHVPVYDGTYSGNVMYCLAADQLCMRLYNVYDDDPVDFGTFSNNQYHNPYNEMSIWEHNTFAGSERFFSLERWQAERGEDAGSARSPLQLEAWEVTSVLGQEQIGNGDFDYDVSGWAGWPEQGVVSHTYSQLDNGAMGVVFSNGGSYPEFTLRRDVSNGVQAQSFYRLRFSIISNMIGELRAAVKGLTQLSGPQSLVLERVPFDQQRRDVVMIFESDLTDQARVQFTNHFNESTYFLDNVSLERVAVQAHDPFSIQELLFNETSSPQTYSITGCWAEVDGTLHSGSITLQPFEGMVIVKQDDLNCGLSTDVPEESGYAVARTTVHPNPALPGTTITWSTAAEGGVVRLMDTMGRLVHSWRPEFGSQQLALPDDLLPGTYLLVASQATARIMVQR